MCILTFMDYQPIELDYDAIALQIGVRLADLSQERVALETRLKEVNGEMRQLNKTLEGLRPLTDGEIGDSVAGMGITHAIRKMFARSKGNEWLAADDVRRKLEKMGFSFAAYKAPQASVYTVLNRLAVSEEIESMLNDDGRFYRKKQ